MYDPRIGRWLTMDPIGFDAGDPNLYRYVNNNATNLRDPSGTYEIDVHFYMTYFLGVALGLDDATTGFVHHFFAKCGGDDVMKVEEKQNVAYMIAWADGNVDEDSDTSPFKSADIRLRFHFRHTFLQDVTGGSPAATEPIDLAMKDKTADVLLMGIGLHAYQDSFSHEGFSHRAGHWTHDPDRPYNGVDKAMSMAHGTYDKLSWFRARFYPDVKKKKTWDQIKAKIRSIFEIKEESEWKRTGEWADYFKDTFGYYPPLFTAGGDKSEWRDQFLEGAGRVGRPE